MWPVFLFNVRQEKRNIKKSIIFYLILFTSHFVLSNRTYIANGNDMDIPTIHITTIIRIQTPKCMRERNG